MYGISFRKFISTNTLILTIFLFSLALSRPALWISDSENAKDIYFSFVSARDSGTYIKTEFLLLVYWLLLPLAKVIHWARNLKPRYFLYVELLVAFKKKKKHSKTCDKAIHCSLIHRYRRNSLFVVANHFKDQSTNKLCIKLQARSNVRLNWFILRVGLASACDSLSNCL